MKINIRGIQIQLLGQKAIFLDQQKILVVADMHLGKLVHFRKNGIFVPTPAVNEDLKTLIYLIEKYEPVGVVFLGDLFHSEKNSEYQRFVDTIGRYPHIQFTLTKGNHDIIPEELFNDCNVSIVEEMILGSNIVLAHQLPKYPDLESFYIIGHIHPGYRFEGRGRQNYRFPCFHLRVDSLTLPAFGRHTGLFIPEFIESDQVYVVINEEVVKIP